MDDDGDFVVAWSDDRTYCYPYPYGYYGYYPCFNSSHVVARRYKASGAAQGNQFDVAHDAFDPAVTMNADGGFAVAWDEALSDGLEIRPYPVYVQRYNGAGLAQGTPFRVTTTEAANPALAMDADGDFVVAWQSFDGDGSGIYAQRYESARPPPGARSSNASALTPAARGLLREMARSGSSVGTVFSDDRDASLEDVLDLLDPPVALVMPAST